ncbi:hypothetical protein ACFFIX_10145 [Metabacillus herbersteinensis]|uniref:Uncharacterized protein n=1 Tax=Metabacillus herbersteinensis TaxID=283816 RepID=A0ABV6GDR2_9BACI
MKVCICHSSPIRTLELIVHIGLKNGDVAFRGYGIIDQEGKVVFKTANRHWVEQLDKTVKRLRKNTTNYRNKESKQVRHKP